MSYISTLRQTFLLNKHSFITATELVCNPPTLKLITVQNISSLSMCREKQVRFSTMHVINWPKDKAQYQFAMSRC